MPTPGLTCQIGDGRGAACTHDAEVKVADSWGDTAWACLLHVEEVLIAARGVLITNQDEQGLDRFLANRR